MINFKINPQMKAMLILIPGILFWGLGSPSGLDPNAYHLFLIFITVIISLVTRLFPMAVSVLIGLLFCVMANILTLKSALKGFSDSTTWLVVIAFLIAGSVIETGLGRRISLICILALGRTITGLGYAICLSELILGPVVPSNTARGGGILAPIVDSMSRSLKSTPKKNPKKAGEYLHLVGAHANLITAAMFLTGMAANPLVAKAASDIFQIEFDWFTWAKGSIVPGLIGLAGLPILIRFLSPPSTECIQPIRDKIREDFQSLGSWTYQEIVTASALGFMLVLWSTKPIHGFGTTTVALLGLIIILITQSMTWTQMVKNYKA
ncbi:MAG: DASS family sodium-coupled anion symporter, partial [Candidatus Marinimicrobia bacterium]|nr:DASS family sodium-coupled anion symporter [Candidatus Neomarinimicrobiota bacterium]